MLFNESQEKDMSERPFYSPELQNRSAQDPSLELRQHPIRLPSQRQVGASAVELVHATSPEASAHEIDPPHATHSEVHEINPLPHGEFQIIASPKQQQLLVETWNALEEYCFNLTRNHTHADDLAQNARIKFLTKVASTVQEVPQVRAWLFKTAYRDHISDARKFEGRRVSSVEPSMFTSNDHSRGKSAIDRALERDARGQNPVEEQLLQNADAEEIGELLVALREIYGSERWQLVVDLYIEERDAEEIAAEAGISPNTLSARQTRLWYTIRDIIRQQKKGGKEQRIPKPDLLLELLEVKRKKAIRKAQASKA